MKITLLCNIDNDAKLGDLQGYNQVYGYFLRFALIREGVECDLVNCLELIKAKEPPPYPDLTSVVAISSTAINWIRNQWPETGHWTCRGSALYHLTDAITRSIVPWDAGKGKGAYVGMGVDSLLCRPNQDATPTVLFNAWNKTVDNGEWGDLRLVEAKSALQKAMKRGVRVLALNCKVDGAENIGRDVYDSDKLGYVKWLEIVSAYSKGWVFLDTTPKVIELGRVEAAVCGASLPVPRSGSDWDRNNPIEGLHHLSQTYQVEGRLYDQIMGLCDKSAFRPFAASHVAGLYFSWENVAKRVVNFLEAQCLEN